MRKTRVGFLLILILLMAFSIPVAAQTSLPPDQGKQPNGNPMKSQLNSLVSSGVITQSQEDAVLEILVPGEETAPDKTTSEKTAPDNTAAGGARQDFTEIITTKLDSLVSSGVITQSQEDAIQAALKPPADGPSSTLPDGDSRMQKPAGVNSTAKNTDGIVLKIGSSKMSVKGMETDIDPGYQTAPVVLNGVTFIPVRSVIESLGGTVDWNSADKSTTITLNNIAVVLKTGSSFATVNGTQKELNGTPFISDTGRTMLPLRFISENLGHSVSWDESTQIVVIN